MLAAHGVKLGAPARLCQCMSYHLPALPLQECEGDQLRQLVLSLCPTIW